MNKLKWDNLKINKCPQCNKDFMKGVTLSFDHQMMAHNCGFQIGQRRYKEIVNNMVTQSLKENEQTKREYK